MLRENVTKPVRSDSTSCPPAERRGERFAHDDGNVLTDDSGRREFTWDAENRLIQVKPGTGYEYPGAKCVQFAYDYRGRRVWKEARTWSNGQWQSPTAAQQRRYLWDGGKLLEEFNASSTVLRKYTWGLDLAGLSGSVNSLEGAGTVGGLLAHHDTALATARDFVYLYDGNGNVGQVVEPATATIYAKHEYDPFGGYRFSSQSGLYYPDYSFTFQFSTKQFDVETNFGYWGERYYLPEYGRWASQDPIGHAGGANLYGYVLNDPIGSFDPVGQCGPPVCAIYTTEVGANGSSSDGGASAGSPLPPVLLCLQQQTQPSAGQADRAALQPVPYDYKNPPGACKTERDPFGWIECYQHHPIVCMGSGGTTLKPYLKECLIEHHEKFHVGQFPADVCKDKPDGFWQFVPTNKVSDYECPAYKSQLKCVATIDCAAKYPGDKKEQKECEGRKKGQGIWICGRLTELNCAEQCDKLLKNGKWIERDGSRPAEK
jgi:RHS repeat-associated protein